MPARLGIVAGGGDLPAQLIGACRESGREVFVLAIAGHVRPEDLPVPPDGWIRLGEGGAGIRLMREAGVSEIVLAGRVRRPSLAELRPDAWTAKLVARLGWRLLGDDSALSALVGALEREGFTVTAAERILAGLLATDGVYGAVAPDAEALADIERGLEVGRAIGALDIGQAVIVQQGYVLGVEAAEGTDRLIERCAALKRAGPGGVLVKLAKPGQERRVDLPAVGPDTVACAARSGLRGIAVEAGSVLVVDRPAMVEAADRAGLFVIGVRPEP